MSGLPSANSIGPREISTPDDKATDPAEVEPTQNGQSTHLIMFSSAIDTKELQGVAGQSVMTSRNAYFDESAFLPKTALGERG